MDNKRVEEQKPLSLQEAILNRFKQGNEKRFPDLANVISEIGGEWVLNIIFLAMQDYNDSQTASLQSRIEELEKEVERLGGFEQKSITLDREKTEFEMKSFTPSIR
jgi:hypothetical protein